ncbi:MAG: hypothetical protein R2698_00630 [Microthrixaceae bacterium]
MTRDRASSGTRRTRALLLAALVLGGAGCGDDTTASNDDTTARRAATTTTTASAPTVTVYAEDYKFVGLPKSVKVGTKLALSNRSTSELHELVVIRIPDSETRSVDELVKLPESELDALFGSAQPAAVLLHTPGEGETIDAVGDGTLSSPGRYAVICSIPVGVDPAAYLAAAQSAGDGPPSIPNAGPPHFTQGMYAELTVEP